RRRHAEGAAPARARPARDAALRNPPRQPVEARPGGSGDPASVARLLRSPTRGRRPRRLRGGARARSARGSAHARAALGREQTLMRADPGGAQGGTIRLPLFPLKTVLFPRGRLALRIFEQRYLTMAKSCLAGERPFGVCLITQ